VRQVGTLADGAIIASALINQIEQADPAQRTDAAATFLREIQQP
jgi:tryptophan synthase alpha subunit